MPYCADCSGITLRKLYGNAQLHGHSEVWETTDTSELHFEFVYDFPRHAYFRHHQSWEALVRSADGGCELCSVIYDESHQLSDEQRESLEDKITQGLKTDIRICLDSFAPMPEEEGHAAFPLDALVIQVGDGEEVEDDHDYNTPKIALHLIRSEDSSDELRELDIGRLELDSDLNSERNFEIARSWLCQCLRNHTTTLHDRQPKACGSPRKERLPTRVVDVGLDTGATPKLFISNGKSDDYIALSHCWGGGSGLTLTQENFRTLERAIPMRNAPANFKDAITITRKLGFRFIWIDSLCIIQDSGSDWETEAQRMGNVYKNATLTVAASGSPNTTAGILNRYSPAVSTSLKHDCRLPLEESGPGKVYLCRREPREESFVECLTSLPLATRGWALQEQMLAARTLYFGKRTIYWNCRSHQLSADHATANPFLNGYLPDAIPALFSNSNGREASDERDIYFRWLGIVNVYASRDLTKASDKLPAISGLAAEVSRLTGAKYLAGIWQEDLLNGLLWYPTLSQRNTENLLTGPSWSWVGVDTELQFATRERQRIYTPQDVEVIETETILEGQNIYGAVRSGHVKLKGLAHELWRSRDKYYRPDGDMNQYGYLWKDKDQNCEYTFDDRIDICEGFLPWVLPPINSVPSERDTIEGDWGLALILGVWSFGENDGPSSIDLGDPIEDDRLVVYALLLHPSGDVKEGTYKRVGILGFHSHSHFITETNWRIRQLKII